MRANAARKKNTYRLFPRPKDLKAGVDAALKRMKLERKRWIAEDVYR